MSKDDDEFTGVNQPDILSHCAKMKQPLENPIPAHLCIKMSRSLCFSSQDSFQPLLSLDNGISNVSEGFLNLLRNSHLSTLCLLFLHR